MISGVCHNPKLDGHDQLEQEMTYCQRLQLNSLRFWMKMDEWETRGDAYFDILDNFMRTAWEYGVSSIPILWNGNFIKEWDDPSDKITILDTKIKNVGSVNNDFEHLILGCDSCDSSHHFFRYYLHLIERVIS